jgi:triosephosphate isomerase (TIM)
VERQYNINTNNNSQISNARIKDEDEDPILILNFKNYLEVAGRASIELAKAAQQVSKSLDGRIKIVACPPQPALSLVKENVDIPVFAQHVDDAKEGSTTGYFIPEIAKSFGAQGSLINHSEHRIDRSQTIQNLVDNLRKLQMVSVVCARSAAEVADIARFKPDYIAIEPPELIGSGKAVSKENPAIVTDSIESAAKVSQEVRVICGAGITDAADVRSALKLGAKGILVASGVIKATSWVDKISELASGYK